MKWNVGKFLKTHASKPLPWQAHIKKRVYNMSICHSFGLQNYGFSPINKLGPKGIAKGDQDN